MVSMPGTMSEKFLFTVREDAVAQKINANLKKLPLNMISTSDCLGCKLFWRYILHQM